MKKVFLLLSCCAGLAACSSEPAKKTMNATELANSQQNPASEPDALNNDSATATNTSAAANQLQADTSATKIGTSPTGTPANAGAKLMASSDCGSCHREREKLLGPAYNAVAAKYPSTPANVAMLAKKVISGGKGNWGDIAMTPHPGLSESDAKQMVSYVLSLK
ncbi:MAG: c-type cytochrome [Janthinobacterium lividum]